ncbi:hypothetical protein SEA_VIACONLECTUS_16 [Gordonia phage ViaConlectus]|uniref:Phage head morphogenesis domain-containing protein n=1 Tax=Gordonia phage ViaConlectus TaxID=2972515 RepID=A0A976UE21_9CAUD|nr:hypothetical protein SEA_VIACONLECTUS_16 [Gordonia phage ViaConlectus]
MRDVAAERAAQQQILREAERSIDAATLAAIGGWLAAFRVALLQELGVPARLVAAADDGVPLNAGPIDYALDAAVQRTYGEWANRLENDVMPTVSVAFGDAFQQVRRADPNGAFRLQQEYLAEVSDRLKIWPAGAFEDIRPELIEALSDAATVDEMTDRIGRVLNIDAKTRDLRARINDVEKRLADPELGKDERRTLKAWRRDLWREHDESLNEWQWKARRIARTEAHGAVSAGQLAAAKLVEQQTGLRMWKRWLSTEDTRTRASHRVADGQTCPLDQPFRVGGFLLQHPADSISVAPHEVINCVVGDTRVSGHGQGLRAAARRIHEGTFVHLVTVDGHDLTITPNHPVLTTRGYVPAGRIKPGDYLLATALPVLPEVDDRPPRVDELFGAICETRVQQRVVSGGVDFHGDAAVGTEIEVVRADGLLSDEDDPGIAGGVSERSLAGLGDGEAAGAGDGAACVAPHGIGGVVDGGQCVGATSRVVRGSGSAAALFSAGAFRSEPVRFTSGSDGQSEVPEPADDGRSADADSAAHLQYAHAVGMEPSQVVVVDSYAGRHWVYNLTTSDHWYSGNGIALHNCRCTMLIYDDDELQDEFDEQGGKGDIEPGSTRIGPDDADAADAAIAAVAEDENRALPKLGQRGEDAGQALPAQPLDVEVTDERERVPAPDVETATDARLADYLIRTDELEQDELRELVEAELGRRRESEEFEVQYGQPEFADDVIEIDDDGAWLDDPRWADDVPDVEPDDDEIGEVDVDDWDSWATTDDDLPDDSVPADPPEVVEQVIDPDQHPAVVEAQRAYDEAVAEFTAAADTTDEDRINETLAAMDAAEGALAEAHQLAQARDDDGDNQAKPFPDDVTPDEGRGWPWDDDEDDTPTAPRELTDAERREYEQMEQAELIAERDGISYEQALAELRGLDRDQIHRREFVAQGKREGLLSTSFGDMLDEVHRRFMFDWELMAEEATNGQTLKPRYRDSGVTPDVLWRVNDVTARKYMSDEMAGWFDEVGGRITKADLERMIEAGHITFDAEICLGMYARWSGRRREDYLR